jgi:EF hand
MRLSVKPRTSAADRSLKISPVTFLWLVAFACTTPACSSASTTAAAARKDVKSEYDESGRLTRLTYDRDGDGKIDTWGYMDGSRVVRVEVDENGDGQVDRWEYHTDPPGVSGSMGKRPVSTPMNADGDVTLERIDRATKFDGRITRREYFEHGVLARIEEDTNGDGKIDKWETYSAGTLASMSFDTASRGIPDRRLIYLPDGTLSRIESDPIGTGAWKPLPQ